VFPSLAQIFMMSSSGLMCGRRTLKLFSRALRFAINFRGYSVYRTAGTSKWQWRWLMHSNDVDSQIYLTLVDLLEFV
jgi:hypothetical protein